jgi:hypothetical protein
MLLLKCVAAGVVFSAIGQLQAAEDWAREPSTLQLIGVVLIAMGIVDWVLRARRRRKDRRQPVQHGRRTRNSRRRASHVSRTYTPNRRRGARRAEERSAQPSHHAL